VRNQFTNGFQLARFWSTNSLLSVGG
jgi:hypothetical protein